MAAGVIMSTFVHRVLIVPVSIVAQCRSLAAQFPSGAGMWQTPLSPTGALPATHYISSGKIWQEFADMLASPEALSTATGIPLAQAQPILGGCIVSSDDPWVVLANAGLVLVQGPQ
jgi:hypothetical protein